MGASVTISAAAEEDAEQILKLQYLCFQSEAERYGDWGIEPLTQSLESLRAELRSGHVLVARLGDEVVGSVRGAVDEGGIAHIGKLVVHPRMQRHGLGGRLLVAVENALRAEGRARRFQLFTGHRSNVRLYRKYGYAPIGTEQVSERLSMVTLTKETVAGRHPAGV
ncbi:MULTISPECIES: GNAT family N-acetyltransferase [unclassified Streptomyces]|uniref:GNAT family N-acetyltransferase n=1 Tax=Streptomyces evansiae TaxID=3075535 RepID=A0ABD5E3Q7_9ACTN|nr:MULTISPECIES: GNAT family N-acetyltransferase [unclassified Streptomyces]ASY35858.1 N-acetyltransferase [Streptomyces sp. CLI2509]EGJ78581.1 putative acetyltransferase [Streptomyces sp. Tu6071]MDT0410552.1 GNAT family N-acetyltransferase [Streptomyces sp. DSM 41979]MDT0415631.1 GNAT family N-acetyltransferase [Streptomyces sp. DSM 41982]MDT0420608.1 GNAT family N-acetyltransferase [Streptomyces sp. DSM 41859]